MDAAQKNLGRVELATFLAKWSSRGEISIRGDPTPWEWLEICQVLHTCNLKTLLSGYGHSGRRRSNSNDGLGKLLVVGPGIWSDIV